MRGKGNKARSLLLAGGALAALQDWQIVRGDVAGPLFVPINKGGVLALDRRLTSQAIYDLLAKRGAAAKLADFSPHDLRRTFISDLLDKGADIATVQKLAGHAQVTTTALRPPLGAGETEGGQPAARAVYAAEAYQRLTTACVVPGSVGRNGHARR